MRLMDRKGGRGGEGGGGEAGGQRGMQADNRRTRHNTGTLTQTHRKMQPQTNKQTNKQASKRVRVGARVPAAGCRTVLLSLMREYAAHEDADVALRTLSFWYELGETIYDMNQQQVVRARVAKGQQLWERR